MQENVGRAEGPPRILRFSPSRNEHHSPNENEVPKDNSGRPLEAYAWLQVGNGYPHRLLWSTSSSLHLNLDLSMTISILSWHTIKPLCQKCIYIDKNTVLTHDIWRYPHYFNIPKCLVVNSISAAQEIAIYIWTCIGKSLAYQMFY